MLVKKMENLIAISELEKNLYNNLHSIFFNSEYEIVRVKIYENEKKIVQIMIDHKSRNVDIDDCAIYSRKISDFLDRTDLISENFSLEVSSPGINRPLTRLKDFQKCKGSKVRIIKIGEEDKKVKYKGILAKITENSIVLDQENDLVSIELKTISDAKLLI
tara:strand:- start:1657 stop:2139 length:483 start_codon:yes stop_codon:yes gene_type:complete